VSVSEEFDRDFDYEFVFFHKPDGALIVPGYMFNLPATNGIVTKLVGALQSTAGDTIWQKRILWHAFSRSDREGWNKSAEKIASWKPLNIVPCHGDVIMGNGDAIFRKVFEWHLQGKKN
jgi:hypothetical protein